jgi:hypothetical protein
MGLPSLHPQPIMGSQMYKYRYPENPMIERDFDNALEELARLIEELADLVDEELVDDE